MTVLLATATMTMAEEAMVAGMEILRWLFKEITATTKVQATPPITILIGTEIAISPS